MTVVTSCVRPCQKPQKTGFLALLLILWYSFTLINLTGASGSLVTIFLFIELKFVIKMKYLFVMCTVLDAML